MAQAQQESFAAGDQERPDFDFQVSSKVLSRRCIRGNHPGHHSGRHVVLNLLYTFFFSVYFTFK